MCKRFSAPHGRAIVFSHVYAPPRDTTQVLIPIAQTVLNVVVVSCVSLSEQGTDVTSLAPCHIDRGDVM